ncbi:MAG: hypothetical protein ABI557_21810, partial [Aureliella sp.]
NTDHGRTSRAAALPDVMPEDLMVGREEGGGCLGDCTTTLRRLHGGRPSQAGSIHLLNQRPTAFIPISIARIAEDCQRK